MAAIWAARRASDAVEVVLIESGASLEALLVESEDRLDEVMARTHRRIAAPVLTSLEIDLAGAGPLNEPTVPDALLGRIRHLREGLVQDRVTPLGAQGGLDRVGENIYASQHARTCFIAKKYVFSCHD